MKIFIRNTELSKEEIGEQSFFQNQQLDLEEFIGGAPNRNNGYSNEIEETILLIKKVGELIIEEEKTAKYKRNQSQNYAEDSSEFDKILDETNTSLNLRRHAYKSLFLLSHTILENRIVEFSQLVNRYHGSKKGKLPKLVGDFGKHIDFLEDSSRFKAKSFIPELDKYIKVRNVLSHRVKYLTQSEFEKINDWIILPKAVSIKNTSEFGNNDSYAIVITHSSFIVDYLNKIKLLLDSLVSAYF